MAYYTQRNGEKVHYISEPKFEKLIGIASELEQDTKRAFKEYHRQQADLESGNTETVYVFENGDSVAYGDWKQVAYLNTMDSLDGEHYYLLEVLLRQVGTGKMEKPRHYLVLKSDVFIPKDGEIYVW